MFKRIISNNPFEHVNLSHSISYYCIQKAAANFRFTSEHCKFYPQRRGKGRKGKREREGKRGYNSG